MTLDEKIQVALARPDAEAPVGAAVRALLEDAAAARASDIHLDPSEDGLRIWFRLDGVMQPAGRVGSASAAQFVGKVKVLAGLLTYRNDVAQDGHIPAADAAGAGDLRVSVYPTIDGEKVVLRLFTDSAGAESVEALGFSAEIAERLRAMARRSEGVLLLTGPSGSGKTTTLYALIAEMTRDAAGRRHIVTIEDPVERRIAGATQTQVNPPAGLTFAHALRSLLRHDPNVILVGEVRDRETAQTAFEAGLTGHLMLSTVHAGTAAGVLVRLREMGVEPYAQTAALLGVLAQRLARVACREGPCGSCRGTGYAGRRVFGELAPISEAVREAIAAGLGRDAIQAILEREGMTPLRRAGEALVAAGATTAAEVERLVG